MTRRKTPVPDNPVENHPAAVEPLVAEAEGIVPADHGPDGPDAQPDMATPALAEAADPPPSPSRAPSRGLGVLGPVIGGVLAAAGGFGLAHFDLLGLQPVDRSEEITALAERQSDLAAGMTELVDRIAALEARPDPVPPDLSRIDDLDQRLGLLEATPPGASPDTSALAARLATLEESVATLPTATGDPAEIEAALARLAELEAAAEAQAAATAEVARAAEEARALEALAEVVVTGTGFEAELAAITDPDLTAALAPHVAGVTPLAELQASFPDAARAALQLARRTDGDDGWGSRLTDFLADQTGARSVTPRDGDDPDAILSRAEFALGEGRLADALTELATLPPDLRAPLEDWIAQASARVAVDSALSEAM